MENHHNIYPHLSRNLLGIEKGGGKAIGPLLRQWITRDP